MMTFWKKLTLCALSLCISLSLKAEDTFTPYTTDSNVPENVQGLWENYDPEAEDLNIQIKKEWIQEGVVTRYVTFTVGTFKGHEARIAGYYSFPKNGKMNPAFVWSHGGGQRAERKRGIYFAKHGFATLDINWLGRPLEDGIETNTNWGLVDPTQGPRFYKHALRKSWKHNFQPDSHTIDPVVSPRNSNWFLLAVAGRRAITFLEKQTEVDAEKIGFSGYSMGGMITALCAIDERLKAVVPFVGGTGFKHVDFPGGITGSSLRHGIQAIELYQNTLDASAYWPLVQCPVAFISSSNDFHSTFERIYQSMNLLQHEHWRVSCNIHQNHGPGLEQWALLNLWFDKYLKGTRLDIPKTPPTTFKIMDGTATFTVTPTSQERLVSTEIFYSHDPNSRTRFWKRLSPSTSQTSWKVSLEIRKELPLYVFAICTYKLNHPITLERGETTTFTLNSMEYSLIPDEVNLSALQVLKQSNRVLEDFDNGFQDWSTRDGRTMRTYKFQDPELDRSNNKMLEIMIHPQGRFLSIQLVADGQFLSRENNLGRFTFSKSIKGDEKQIIRIRREDFIGNGEHVLEWSKIASMDLSLTDNVSQSRLHLKNGEAQEILLQMNLVDTR